MNIWGRVARCPGCPRTCKTLFWTLCKVLGDAAYKILPCLGRTSHIWKSLFYAWMGSHFFWGSSQGNKPHMELMMCWAGRPGICFELLSLMFPGRRKLSFMGSQSVTHLDGTSRWFWAWLGNVLNLFWLFGAKRDCCYWLELFCGVLDLSVPLILFLSAYGWIYLTFVENFLGWRDILYFREYWMLANVWWIL